MENVTLVINEGPHYCDEDQTTMMGENKVASATNQIDLVKYLSFMTLYLFTMSLITLKHIRWVLNSSSVCN